MAAPTRRRTPGPRRIGDVWTVLRRARPPARHRHRHHPRVTRHQAGALDRRQHPRRRAHRHGRRVSRPPTSDRRLRRRRRTGHPRAAQPNLLRRAACQPRRCRVGAGRHAANPALERASVAVPGWPPVARSVDRGHRRRRPDPADARPRPERRVDAAPRRAAPPRRRSARRSGPSRNDPLSDAQRGHDRALRRVHRPDARARPRAST